MIQYNLTISGCVQGVGFRPFVYGLATELGLKGKVCNIGSAAYIEVVGSEEPLQAFQHRLWREQPAAAAIESIQCEQVEASACYTSFSISVSKNIKTYQKVGVEVSTDLSICQDCLAELFDPKNRRYRYPFINCTQCGPRYSLIESLPYDRCRTSMKSFDLCAACASEYRSPIQRRFHAQPNACANCGPELSLVNATGQTVETDDPIAETMRLLNDGKILAIKGLTGFHLVCDASNPSAVQTLRQRKQRPTKPFAIMALNEVSVSNLLADDTGKELLESTNRPIVLRRKSGYCDELLAGVVLGLADLGVMLPYTPLHYVLFHQYLNCPSGTDWLAQEHPLKLVMTSANVSGEPLIYQNDEALAKLIDLADYCLLHNRDILRPCDDSVIQAGKPAMVVRRARGMAPISIKLASSGPATLAYGAYLKNTLCLTKGDRAYLSPYIGDLDHPDCCERLQQTADQMMALLDIQPEQVVCDLHPDFFSSQLAERISQERDIPLLKVQHHHAHLAAVMAEHQLAGNMIGIALDGVGLGSGEGREAWGGELFYISEPLGFQRLGHLSKLTLPGSDKAVQEIWRIGAAALLSQEWIEQAEQRYGHFEAYSFICRCLQHSEISQGPLLSSTSSAGRWFDAIASITGLCQQVGFEAQGAMLLEAAASRETLPRAMGLATIKDHELNLYPLLNALVELQSADYAAAVFHVELVDGLVRWLAQACRQHHTNKVVASGGCFLNRILREQLNLRLQQQGITLYLPEQVSCNDSGIALGQAWMALRQLSCRY